MIFEYDQQPVFMKQVQIDDIGNFALRCSNPKGKEFYFVVKTYLGKTALLKFGPVYPDINALVENMDLAFKKFDYKEYTIEREIEKFINDGRNAINEVQVVSENEALAQMPTAESFINSL
jgi:hypothetical protein